MYELVEKVVSEVEFEALRKALRLEVMVDRSVWMNIAPDLFWDALSNLVHNAIKFTDQGFVRVDMEQAENAVIFSVRDSGPGLTSEQLGDLFTKPYASSQSGMGIGLTIVHRAAAALGGTVGAASEPGAGAVFGLRFALEEEGKKKSHFPYMKVTLRKWRPQRDSNPRRRRERAVSWASRRWGR